MKNDLKKLQFLLMLRGFSMEEILPIKMYLAIVLLGKKIPQVAQYYNVKETLVQSALTRYGVRLNNDQRFYEHMHFVFKAFTCQQRLNFAA